MSVIQDATGALALALVVRFLSKTQSKAPITPATPLIPTTLTTSSSVFANPTGYLSGITNLKGLFTPPTVTGLKSVADPFYSGRPLVREPVRERTGITSVYRRPDFAVGPITGIPQSFKLDLSGADFSGTFKQDFASGRF